MTARVKIVENILNANDRLADENRALLNDAGIFSINLIASPGADKTSLVEQTVKLLKDEINITVIDGDIATSLDADRAFAAGAAAIQINTGGECHLDAVMLRNALSQIDLTATDFLIVENVGNLVCPANFKLGTHSNILVASVPEGDDKPYKYPGTYQAMDVIILNKVDLLPYVPFRSEYFERGARAINPEAELFPLSCVTGSGLNVWKEWIIGQIQNHRAAAGLSTVK